jgi:hypothetical protein
MEHVPEETLGLAPPPVCEESDELGKLALVVSSVNNSTLARMEVLNDLAKGPQSLQGP